ncbi:MAG: LysR family transcriptional regulator [Caldilineaceae bacterium]
MLNLYKLEVFDAVVQAGTFSGAAERLLVSQPAISQHIGDLEAAVGARLFARGRRGVTLLPAGETLHRYTRQIFALVSEAQEAVAELQSLSNGQVSIGATPGVGIYLLPDWVQLLRARYPQVTVTLRTGTTAQIADDLRRGVLDVGFVEGELGVAETLALRSLAVREDEQFVVIGPRHAWWSRPEQTQVALEELDGQTLIVRQRNSQSRIWLEQEMERHHLHPQIRAEFDALESIKRAVALGGCLTILPVYVVAAEVAMGLLRALPVQNRPLVRTLKLVWNPESHWSPTVKALLRVLQGELPALVNLPRSAGATVPLAGQVHEEMPARN